jgi:hypothetical protein
MKTLHRFFPAFLFLFIFGKAYSQQNDGLGLERSPLGPDGEFITKKEPFYMPNSLIKPPVLAWDIPKQLYGVDASKGGSIAPESGTRISVPPDAFVDETGEKVSGEVQIDYREFRDPVDMIFSGIPMTYDSGGKVNEFQSAGMFEITASQQGKQVYLAQDKTLKVDFVSNDSSTAYNLYVLDEKKGTWDYLGKPAKPVVFEKPVQTNVVSDSATCWMKRYPQLWNRKPYDTTSFAERFADTSYYFTEHKRQTDFRWNRGMSYYNTMFNSRNRYRSMIRINRVRDSKRGEMAFSMFFTGKEFPEMQAFYGKKWVLTDPETRSSFRAKYGYRNAFNDIRLEPDGEGYAITLKSVQGFVILHAYPVNSRQLEKEEHPAKNTSRIEKYYARRLARREAKFNKMVAGDKQENGRHYKSEAEFLAEHKEYRTQNERALDQLHWKQYYDSIQVANQLAFAGTNSGKRESAFRTVALVALGVYNYDHICSLDYPVVVQATVKDRNDGTALHTKATYLLDGRTNGIRTFKGSDGTTGTRIKFHPQSQNMLICITEDGQIAYCNPDKFRTVTASDKKTPSFPLVYMDPKSKSLTQFKNAIGMK